MSYDRAKLKQALAQLFAATEELQRIFESKRRFTPDGHLVGELGLALALANYSGLTPVHAATKGYDARLKNRKKLEVKATFGKSVSFRDEKPDSVLVLQISRDGNFEEIFNGSAK